MLAPRWRFSSLAALALVVSLLPGTSPHAATQAYSRRWHVIAGGGGISTGVQAPYHVTGTVGQPAARTVHTGPYDLHSGFWSAPFGSGWVAVAPDPPAIASGFRLASPAPNPTHGAVSIAFQLPESREVTVRVFDLQGRELRQFAPARYAAGAQRVAWDGRDGAGAVLPRGLYFVHIDAGRDRGITKVVLLSEGGAR